MVTLLKIIALTVAFGSQLAAEIIWPTNASRKLSSNFGEFRGDRFHMGIDIKTHGKEGFEVYAIQDGFISRMVTNYNGYGKALYLRTTAGRTAVYGHLSVFTEDLETELYKRQEKLNTYHTNSYFDSTAFRFKKGDIIGYTGNTGASFAPHLHFEIRKKNGKTLNPLKQKYSFPDSVYPEIKGVTVFPLRPNTIINGLPIPMELSVKQGDTGKHWIGDAIYCDNGTIGIAVNVEDKIQYSWNRYQFYKIELYINDSLFFEFSYDSLSFEQSGYMNSVENRFFGGSDGITYHNLFLSDNSPFLLENKNKTGHISLSPGVYNVQLKVTDVSGNISTLNGQIIWGKTERETMQTSRVWLHREPTLSICSHLNILYSPGGLFVEYKDLENKNMVKEVFFIQNGDKSSFDLIQSSPRTYYSRLIPFENFKNMESVLIQREPHPYQFKIKSKVIYPTSQSDLKSYDGLFTVQITDSTLYDTSMLWIEKNEQLFNTKFKLPILSIYKIEPWNLPLKNPAIIRVNLNQHQSQLTGLGLYKYNFKRGDWQFQGKRLTGSSIISAEASDLGVFTVLQDTVPPEIINIYPSQGHSYDFGEIFSIECVLNDNLSGIKPTEEALNIILNGNNLYCAYQPIKKKLSYRFQSPLTSGTYAANINAKDNVGNKMEFTLHFTVN